MRHFAAEQRATPLAVPHATPQAPQWAASVSVSVSQPSASTALQFACPVKQAIAQVPLVQLELPLAVPHARAHAPQCAVAVRMSVSQPFAFAPSQSPKPTAHAIAHAPDTHDAVPLPVPHT